MSLTGVWGLVLGIISIIVGILVIVRPKLLAYIVGAYLIVVGAIAVIGYLL
ncbi:MAG: DUF3096 domain-containing protein [Chloroflexota bacterium]|nr:DUF3096 domain-containing protein [Chloroflexota bacterium]